MTDRIKIKYESPFNCSAPKMVTGLNDCSIISKPYLCLKSTAMFIITFAWPLPIYFLIWAYFLSCGFSCEVQWTCHLMMTQWKDLGKVIDLNKSICQSFRFSFNIYLHNAITFLKDFGMLCLYSFYCPSCHCNV